VYSAEDEETLGFLRQVREHVKALRTSDCLPHQVREHVKALRTSEDL
jgi:hypothetical protein